MISSQTDEICASASFALTSVSIALQLEIVALNDLSRSEIERRRAIVVDDYEGILPYFEAMYLQSIIYAADRSEFAFGRFEKLIATKAPSSLAMATIQEALTHAGALSRFFFPVKKENIISAARAEKLRKAFLIETSSPLRWRRLRNAFEHFDEELDRFLLQNDVGYFYPIPIVGDHSLANEPVSKIFKLVDPQNGICVILGESYEYPPIRQEVKRVLELAIKLDEAGGRLAPR